MELITEDQNKLAKFMPMNFFFPNPAQNLKSSFTTPSPKNLIHNTSYLSMNLFMVSALICFKY